LPSKNPYTDAILSIADEYKNLIGHSKKKGNKTPETMTELPKNYEMFPKTQRQLKGMGVKSRPKRNIIG
jgi:hypothetical protein|tara:strand:- start:82 stop:288 length:207 start_codon:yes stop_codon:yes gene_type:complete